MIPWTAAHQALRGGWTHGVKLLEKSRGLPSSESHIRPRFAWTFRSQALAFTIDPLLNLKFMNTETNCMWNYPLLRRSRRGGGEKGFAIVVVELNPAYGSLSSFAPVPPYHILGGWGPWTSSVSQCWVKSTGLSFICGDASRVWRRDCTYCPCTKPMYLLPAKEKIVLGTQRSTGGRKQMESEPDELVAFPGLGALGCPSPAHRHAHQWHEDPCSQMWLDPLCHH